MARFYQSVCTECWTWWGNSNTNSLVAHM